MRALGRGLIACTVISGFLLLVPSVAEAQRFRNCDALRITFPNGVAVNFNVIGSSQAELNRAVYLRNQRFDRDRDGIACEWEYLQTPAVTTTTAPPRTRTTPVSDLPAFVTQFAGSVVTVECGRAQGSGVSIPAGTSSWSTDLGAKSFVATNMHVVIDCIYSGTNYRSNQVLIRHQGTEYVGYVSGWPSFADYRSGAKPDLALVMTTGVIAQTSYWNVRRPKLGDAVVAIGSAGGIPNTTTRGEIAAVSSRDIVTTAPAGHGSSGGALFNNDGQLVGIIYAGNGSLVQVVPIPRFCEAVFTCSSPIDYVD